MPSATEKYSLFEMQFLACSSASLGTLSYYTIELLVMSWLLSDPLSKNIGKRQ
jgi:DNA polymerase sigma